ncbi:hypothetical protein A8709_06985 [Paenibacillus pectinilyticus]|uniref:HD family phosphohydrolase n=1 Tax=Paenibacillus pectinilyticus TaxID=512399 RepID=A0A1C0ZTL1_9BACL|nr:hypothetical protein [Paenibacillus pectinilyticus]OCT11409.1 hypothetical protein A8709_06985 [Paenibacillus pectinilyticus]
MKWIVGYYGIQAVILLVIIILSVLFYDKRYKKRKSEGIPTGFLRTEEVSVDPITQEKQRVYYNPDTGERIYVRE